MPSTFQETIALAADLAVRVRAEAPRVHCLTNTVAEPITANTLLALGAVPSMTSYSPELPDFLAGAKGLMVNVGTPTAEKAEARRLAVRLAQEQNIPWVLDPVMVHWSETRKVEAVSLLAGAPTAIRGNAQEIEALGEGLSSYVGAQAITGAVDRIVQGTRHAEISGGTPMLAQVTAAGCALSAVVAAFCACHEDAFEASLAACAIFAAAGAKAASGAKGPGTFAASFLDCVASVNATDLDIYLRTITLTEEDAA